MAMGHSTDAAVRIEVQHANKGTNPLLESEGGLNPLLGSALVDDVIGNIHDMIHFLGRAVLADGIGDDESKAGLAKCLDMIEEAVEYVEQSVQGRGLRHV